jgi:integrase
MQQERVLFLPATVLEGEGMVKSDLWHEIHSRFKLKETKKAIAAKARSPLQKAFPDLILFAAHTGLRKSEILNLRWKDVKGDEISVLDKGSRRRTVPLNQTARGILERQARRGEFVFDIPNRDRKDLVRRTVAQIAKRIEIDFGFHDLRHYFTTALIEKGVDLITISALLGHSKTMTSLIYSHTDGRRQKKAVDLLI